MTQCDWSLPVEAVGSRVWSALIAAQIFTVNADGAPYIFATGETGTLKVDGELLQRDPFHYGVVLGFMATHACVRRFGALAFVPNGTRDPAERIAGLTGKPVIYMERPEGAGRYEYQFCSPADSDLVAVAGSVTLLEDVSRTGSSAYAAGQLLRQANPAAAIHSLSMLQRGPIDSQYETGPHSLVYHTLCRRDVPLDVADFTARYGITPRVV